MNKEEREEVVWGAIVLVLLFSLYAIVQSVKAHESPEPYQSECTDIWVHSSSPRGCE